MIGDLSKKILSVLRRDDSFKDGSSRGLLGQSVLICHSNLGTKHKSHQILITISYENGVIGLQNEEPLCIFTQMMSNTIQDHAASMNEKAI